MGDMGDIFNAMRDERRALRSEYGVNCPSCQLKQPLRTPTILLPGQQCKVDGYRDQRPRLTDEQRQKVFSCTPAVVQENEMEKIACPHCGKRLQGKNGVYMHLKMKHSGKGKGAYRAA